MTATRTIETLRSILFDQLETLASQEKSVDLGRARLVNETAQLIVNTAKVEVEHAKVLKGALTLPFIEDQESLLERPHQPNPEASQPQKLSTQEKLLNGNANHPWRTLGTWKRS